MKILLTDVATVAYNYDIDISVFSQFGELVSYDNITREELLEEVKDTDIILLNKTVIDKEVFDAAQKLKYIGLFATGYNNIDTVTAKKRGIPVCNAGSYSTNAVAQQTIAYILNHYTNISRYNEFVHEGGWGRSPVFSVLIYPGGEVFGKTLGIVGYGNIGKAVKKAAEGLGMNVIVHTRTVREEPGTRFVELDTLLKESDVVSLHCPLNSQSEKMMNAEAFAKMKDGAFFVNTSRGGVVDEQALFDALESGKLSGAAVDVVTKEPADSSCVLLKAKNLVMTPHTAWAPLETRKRLLNIVTDNIQAFLDGKPKNNVAI